MTEDNVSPLDDAQRAAIGRKHLAKALVKAIPKVGDVINEMVFERAQDEANVQDKAKLNTILHTLLSNQDAQNTDLGDLLNRVDQQAFQMQQVRDALVALTHYFWGQADTATTHQVEIAAERALPGYVAGASHSMDVQTLDRFVLRKAIEERLQPEEWELVLGDIPGATRAVYNVSGMPQQINKLLNWAEGINGPGLDKIYTYIKRAFPRFTINP